tara:strand:+ start:168 stop:1289 length:1122 start_codon:yes stop_codon:yes gene_type:complete
MTFSLKDTIFKNLKNFPGWRTNRKIVVFSIDDYGNIRMASKAARDILKAKGLAIDSNRFDLYDSLETAEDLEALFETLQSVKDKNGNNAIFTSFTNVANINFEAIEQNGFEKYEYESILDSYEKMPSNKSPWKIFKEGIEKNLIVPESHGREHVNLEYFNELLKRKDAELISCILERSFGGLNAKPFKNIGYTAAFDFENNPNFEKQKEILTSGLELFEEIFGRKASHFNAPGAHEHHFLESTMFEKGINFIDTDFIKREHQGNGVYSNKLTFNGNKNKLGQIYFVRNCVFEPLLDLNKDYVDSCLKEIEIAFRYNKPANISSHRVNFSGEIDSNVRLRGLSELKRLLLSIVKKWPEVEFMCTNELGFLMKNN